MCRYTDLADVTALAVEVAATLDEQLDDLRQSRLVVRLAATRLVQRVPLVLRSRHTTDT